MTPDRHRMELLAARYLEAVEADDFATMTRLWKLAEAEPELVTVFRQVHEDLLAEQREQEAATTTDVVTTAAETHLTSGEIVRDPTAPLTVAAVADELFRHTPDRLPAEAHTLNEKLRASQEPLPMDLGLTKFVAWAESKFGPAPEAYWRAFFDAALKLELRRDAAEYQLAARSVRNPKKGSGS